MEYTIYVDDDVTEDFILEAKSIRDVRKQLACPSMWAYSTEPFDISATVIDSAGNSLDLTVCVKPGEWRRSQK